MTAEEKQKRQQRRVEHVALAAEERSRQREERIAQWRDSDTYMSYEELRAGEPCRGCGQPILGDGTWEDLPRQRENPERREVRLAEDARFETQHADCATGGLNWSMQGSPVRHCGACCPPPPLSPGQLATIANIFTNAQRSPNPNLVRWALTLRCGHLVERTADQHHTYHPATGDYSSVFRCDVCSEERGVIAVERLGPVAPTDGVPAAPSKPRVSQAKLNATSPPLSASWPSCASCYRRVRRATSTRGKGKARR
jgi:hypothetical protein